MRMEDINTVSKLADVDFSAQPCDPFTLPKTIKTLISEEDNKFKLYYTHQELELGDTPQVVEIKGDVSEKNICMSQTEGKNGPGARKFVYWRANCMYCLKNAEYLDQYILVSKRLLSQKFRL